MSKEDLCEKYSKLESAMNAVAGCGMFAPEPLKSQDLPRLIEAMQDASVEFGEALERFGETAQEESWSSVAEQSSLSS